VEIIALSKQSPAQAKSLPKQSSCKVPSKRHMFVD